MLRLACVLSLALGCAFDDPDEQGDVEELVISNGVELMPGVDPDRVTTLSGGCRIETDVGAIECDGLVIRLNAPGVYDGIGWEVIGPTASSCAGSTTPAPRIAVFSFGSLHIAASASVSIEGSHVAALVAADSIDVSGQVWAGAGRFLPSGFGGIEQDPAMRGPSPGAHVSGETDSGAGGAGAVTAGGAGGNAGGAPGNPLPAQLEPLCGGSAGGSVGDLFPEGGGVNYGDGGEGGAALLLAAGGSIAIQGSYGCGLFASGGTGQATERGGAGGGSGGTISLESPSITAGGSCRVEAIGGFGASSPTGALGGAAGDGTVPAGQGADGALGGGGGGAAGFIRVRTATCPFAASGLAPPPTCELLP